MSIWSLLYDAGYIDVKDHKPSYTSKGRKWVSGHTKRRYKRGEITQSEMLETISKINFPAITTTAPPKKPTVYEILSSGTTQSVRDTLTGDIVGYLGRGDTITDIHGVIIGTYKGKENVELKNLIPVPKRPGIPYCEEKNYRDAQKYLWDLQQEGKIPGGVKLVQTPEGWKYVMPEKGKELVKLDEGGWVYREGYSKLTLEQQDYLNKYGVDYFNNYYIPAQKWLAEATEKQRQGAIGAMKPYFMPAKIPEGITNPVFVRYIKKNFEGYDLIAAIEAGIDKKYLNILFPPKIVARAEEQCQRKREQEAEEAPPTLAGMSELSMGKRVKESLKATATEPFFVMNELGTSMGNIQEFSKQQPTNIFTAPYKIPAGLLTGAAMIMVVPAMLWAIGTQPTLTGMGRAAKDIGKGTITFFASLPVAIKADPYFTSGMIAGMILGPKGVLRTAKTARVWVDPYGTPARSIGIEFSTARATIGKLSQADLGRAVDLAQRQIAEGKLKGTVVVKGVKINYRGAPIQQTVGGVLFSAVPDATNFIKPGTIRINPGGLYTSVSASQRFLVGGAKGGPIVNPAMIAILTDVAKMQRVPKSVLGRATQSDWYIRQAHEGFHGPSKIYRHAWEAESPFAPKTALAHAPTTLRSRILGTKAGDFFTQYTGPDVVGLPKGKLVPVHFLLDRGVFRQPPSPALMYATKLLTIKETLLDFKQALRHPTRTVKDIVSRRIGPKGVREMEVYRVKNAAEWAAKLTEEAIKKSKEAPKPTKEGGYVYPEAFRRSLVRAFETERAKIYRLASGAMEGAYAANPKIYENLYRYNLERNLRAATIAYSSARAIEDTRRGVERGLPVVERYAPPRPTERDFARRGIVEPRTPRRARREAPKPRVPIRYKPLKVPRIERGIITTKRLVTIPRKRIILLPSGESRQLTKKQWEGIIAWKQGFMYKLIYPNYGPDDIINSRKQLADVKYHKGIGSAYKSVIAKGGVVPREVLRDMGIMDLRFRTDRPTSKKPKLFYKRDIKQKTTTTPGISGVR